MERDRAAAGHRPAGGGRDGAREVTPDSATWDAEVDAEIELLGDHEPVDVVDVVDESWAPGEPPPGVPGDEVLSVHPLTEREPPAEELDMSDAERDELGPTPGGHPEGEAGR